MKGRRGFRSLLTTPPPTVGVEIAPRRVTVVAIERDGTALAMVGSATIPLPETVLAPGLNTSNVLDPSALADAIRRGLAAVGRRTRRIVLAVPDPVGKVSVVRFENVPTKEDDLAQLIRWQVRKTAPFRLEDAQLTYAPAAPTPTGGREFLVVVARRDLIEEYERVCQAAGVHAGVVDLASLSLVHLALGAGAGRDGSDWLLVHQTPTYTSVAIVRGAHPIFFRTRPSEGDGDLTDLVHQTAMYYEDRVSGPGLTRVFAAGLAYGDGEQTRRALEDRLGIEAHPIELAPAVRVRDRIRPEAAFVETVAAPLGLLLREHPASGSAPTS